MTVNKGVFILTVTLIIFIAYYHLDYKRYFITNESETEVVTIWQRMGNDCYIIPGKYYWVFPPNNNFIKTVNYRNYIGIIWNTEDEFAYKISIYNQFERKDLEEKIGTYSSNDSLLYEYGIFETFDTKKGLRKKNANSDSLERILDYTYVDLNRVYGIKIYTSTQNH